MDSCFRITNDVATLEEQRPRVLGGQWVWCTIVGRGQNLVYGSCEEFFLGRCKDGVLFILCILLLLLFSDLLSFKRFIATPWVIAKKLPLPQLVRS